MSVVIRVLIQKLDHAYFRNLVTASDTDRAYLFLLNQRMSFISSDMRHFPHLVKRDDIGIILKSIFRTCPHRNCVRIFEHNFDEGKVKKRKHTVVW